MRQNLTPAKSPTEIIQFVRQQIQNKAVDESLIIMIEQALLACAEQDNATCHTLQGLLCQVYLNLENLPKPKNVEEKDEKKSDKGSIKIPSYRYRAHDILLHVEPAQLGMNPEALEACGESLILIGSGGGDYVHSTSQSRPSIINKDFNVHRVRLKGLQYFAAALLHIPISSDNQTNQETFFLSYLGLDESVGENRRALKDWLNKLKQKRGIFSDPIPEKGLLEGNDDDKSIIVQKKLDALEERAQRVEQVGWDSATQDLISHLVRRRAQGGDETAEKFYQGFVSLKFKFELAVGIEQKELVSKIASEISEHIQQEMIRIEKQEVTSRLPLSTFYVRSLRNLLHMGCISQDIPSTSQLEVKTTVPLINEAEETKAFADLIRSLDKSVIREAMGEQKGDDFNFRALLFIDPNHEDACLKLIDSLDEKSLIRLVQLRNKQGATPLHFLSSGAVGEAVINKLQFNPDVLAEILFLQDAQGQSVAEVVIFKFPDLCKPIIKKLNSDRLFALCQQKIKLVLFLMKNFLLQFRILIVRLSSGAFI